MTRDRWIDDELRRVPLPEGLRERLRRTALGDDAGLDAVIADVPTPAGLNERLRNSIATLDDGLDALLVDAPRADVALWRAKQLPSRAHKLRWAARLTAAALLFVAIGVSYLGAGWAMLTSMLPGPASPPEMLMATAPAEPLTELPLESLTVEPSDGADWAARESFPPELVPARPVAPEPMLADDRRPVPAGWAATLDALSPAPRDDLWIDLAAARWGVFGSHGMADDPPVWREAAQIPARGIAAPTALGYDAVLLIRFGVHPFVSPATDGRLRSMTVPLNVPADSFETARAAVSRGRLPVPAEVRTEEFLAALDYDYPQPEGRPLGVTLMGAPSPFWPEVHLLQAGVQAAPAPEAARAPTHLVIALDASASMKWKDRLSRIGRGIQTAADRLRPMDRLSLIVFRDDAELLVDRATRADAAMIGELVQSLSAEGPTNIGAGLGRAFSLACAVRDPEAFTLRGPVEAAPSGNADAAAVAEADGAARAPTAEGARADEWADERAVVALLTDGLGDLPPETMLRLERRLSEGHAAGVDLHVVDLRPDALEPDLQLASLAAAGGGRLHDARDRRQVAWALEEILGGRSLVVAQDVELSMSFNPRQVAAYRVLGHEPGLKTAESRCDFHGGQSATTLWEVRLKQPKKGESSPSAREPVATATLRWKTGDGQSHRSTAVFRRGDFAPAPDNAPPAWKAAAVAAETAELLRGSVFTRIRRRPGSLAATLAWADRLHQLQRENESFNQLVDLLRQAVRSRPGRGG